MVKYSFIFGANRSSHITYKHVWTVCATPLTTLLTTLHTQKKNKMVNKWVAAAMICFVWLDDDEVKNNRKNTILDKKTKIKRRVFKYSPLITHRGYCQFQRNAASGLWHFLKLVSNHWAIYFYFLLDLFAAIIRI